LQDLQAIAVQDKKDKKKKDKNLGSRRSRQVNKMCTPFSHETELLFLRGSAHNMFANGRPFTCPKAPFATKEKEG
jgi:hypothetical protein